MLPPRNGLLRATTGDADGRRQTILDRRPRGRDGGDRRRERAAVAAARASGAILFRSWPQPWRRNRPTQSRPSPSVPSRLSRLHRAGSRRTGPRLRRPVIAGACASASAGPGCRSAIPRSRRPQRSHHRHPSRPHLPQPSFPPVQPVGVAAPATETVPVPIARRQRRATPAKHPRARGARCAGRASARCARPATRSTSSSPGGASSRRDLRRETWARA